MTTVNFILVVVTGLFSILKIAQNPRLYFFGLTNPEKEPMTIKNESEYDLMVYNNNSDSYSVNGTVI